VLPLQSLVKEIYKCIGEDRTQSTLIKTTVHEDNNGALKLAQMEPGRSTPWSKHYGIKYHWFRSKLKPNNITLQRIDTKEQRADILTKGLRTDNFEEN
jgi:hypothetical protein